jgi:CHAT domain-containing protein/tetratricopeptide (TPR) repeat protein
MSDRARRALCGLLSACGFLACSEPPAPAAPRPDRAGVAAPAGISSPAPLDSLIAHGESLYFLGAYDSATVLWTNVLERARSDGDPLSRARSLTWLGLAAWKLGDYEKARRLAEQSLQLKLAHGLEAELFKSYNALGLIDWNQGRLVQAAELFGKALGAARAAKDAKGTAGTSANLALVWTDLGEFALARDGFRRAEAAGHQLGDARVEGNALTNLGMLDIRAGDPESALLSLRKARALYRSIGYAAGEQTALAQMGTAFATKGEFRLAFAALDTALALSRRQGLRQEEAGNLESLAELYRQAGDNRRALQFYSQAKAINSALGLDLQTAADLRSEAQVHLALGDPRRARAFAAEALQIHRSAAARHEELADLLLLADLASRLGERDAARRALAEAEDHARRLESRQARVDLAITAARVHERADDPSAVLNILDQAADDLGEGHSADEWEAHGLRARAYARRGELELAVDAGRRAVGAVERVRERFGSGQLRTSYVTDRARVYTDLVDVLLRLGRAADAFEVSDAARGRALREHLSAFRDRSQPLATTRTLAEAELALTRIDALVTQTEGLEEIPVAERPADHRALLAQLTARLEGARNDFEALQVRSAEREGALSALLGAATVRVGDVQSSLLPGEVLLEYLVAADRVLLFVVAPRRIEVFDCGLTAKNLASRVRLATDRLGRRGRFGRPRTAAVGGLTAESTPDERIGHEQTPLAALHAALIGPALRSGALLGAHRLVIVPHGPLGHLPFAALRDRDTQRWLVEDFALAYLPSAAVLPAVRHRPSAMDKRAQVNVSVFAPNPEELPATRTEARDVQDHVRSARLHLGEGATEAALRRELGTHWIVHVAGHGRMNARNPSFSRLELRRGSGVGSANDGRFEVHELFELRVRSPLVFLSGCETGRGLSGATIYNQGEDYATLARAFLYAGAGNVVSTLWPVQDEGAGLFAREFYRGLRRHDPAEALSAAQRSFLRRDEFTDPYHWAGYLLSGSGQLTTGSSGTS